MANRFGEILRNLRTEKNLSQQQLAQRLYVNRSSVVNWETGRRIPAEAINYAYENLVSIAFLDIELGSINGIDLCKTLMDINNHINVIFLTSYPDYAVKAWSTAASGFLIKPLQLEDVNEQLEKLRFPVRGLK